jgi:hypothetical protein
MSEIIPHFSIQNLPGKRPSRRVLRNCQTSATESFPLATLNRRTEEQAAKISLLFPLFDPIKGKLVE